MITKMLILSDYDLNMLAKNMFLLRRLKTKSRFPVCTPTGKPTT